jgi:hypothetical protein
MPPGGVSSFEAGSQQACESCRASATGTTVEKKLEPCSPAIGTTTGVTCCATFLLVRKQAIATHCQIPPALTPSFAVARTTEWSAVRDAADRGLAADADATGVHAVPCHTSPRLGWEAVLAAQSTGTLLVVGDQVVDRLGRVADGLRRLAHVDDVGAGGKGHRSAGRRLPALQGLEAKEQAAGVPSILWPDDRGGRAATPTCQPCRHGTQPGTEVEVHRCSPQKAVWGHFLWCCSSSNARSMRCAGAASGRSRDRKARSVRALPAKRAPVLWPDNDSFGHELLTLFRGCPTQSGDLKRWCGPPVQGASMRHPAWPFVKGEDGQAAKILPHVNRFTSEARMLGHGSAPGRYNRRKGRPPTR